MGKAVAALLGTGLVTLAAMGVLLIWHMMRRGRFDARTAEPPADRSTTGSTRP